MAAAKSMKKAVTKGQASAVASFLKSQKSQTGKGAPKQPTANTTPMADDDDDDQSQGS